MSLINENLKKIIPPNSETFNVSFDRTLGNTGIEITNWLEENNKMEASHAYGDVTYRWCFGISGVNSIGYIINNLPENLGQIFVKNVIDYLNIESFAVNEIKFEKLGPNHLVDDIHLRRPRFGEIIPVLEDNLPTDYAKTIFYSSLWHTDKSFALNNYKILVYLNDIEEGQGGLTIADPVISPSMVDNKCVLHEVGQTYKADQIKGKEITGPAGTCASFNSHILHRANLPKQGHRYCMHLSFLLPGIDHKHDKYSINHL